MYQVMIVEDEHWIRGAIAKMVEQMGSEYEVVAEVGNGEEALQMIYTVWPSIVITDIMMPIQDGLWLVREIHERRLPIITVIVTGYSEFEYARQALRYNVSDFLLKPVMEEELNKALQNACEGIAQFINLRQYFLSIQQFFDKITDMDPQSVFKEQADIVQQIIGTSTLQESEKMIVLKTFSGKFNDLIQGMEPSFTRMEIAQFKQEQVTQYFHTLTQHWIQYYNTIFNIDMRQLVRKACEFLHAHYAEELSITEMTNRFHISVSQFSLLFKKYTGQTFINYLTALRIQQAKLLLMEGNLRIYEIAELVGFNSLPHFNRVFKQNTGQSPNEYRKSMGV
ncbi:helix-turn-helix domain-containing protein [Paenibacillus qinlingensis]|uniref:helix-turn-helix domain-containing protein n=1 Tax=Paenibacillus qinlingensis TaxID=1837343 RepID=UPI001563B7EE|nr:helix-turn-helix domain-containing protein [Paenibacillus qinlingensis]NQX60496.1 response regulator [Paenibacillus qinlingensis]